MTFNLCPDDGPPRLWRFVAPGVLPPEVLATLDIEQNLLTIDKSLFSRLGELNQHMLLRTHARTTFLYDEGEHVGSLASIF
jgi:hypothetical protein